MIPAFLAPEVVPFASVEVVPAASLAELILIDLSSIAHPIWHKSQSEPDPNHTSIQIVARVRAITSGKPYAAVCCDSGRSFRKDIADSYKANRPASEAPLQHQIALAREQLVADGFPVWAVKGFEADDLIASAAGRAIASGEMTVLIVSADKDLLQLVGASVRAMSVRDGSILDSEAVKAKFGVEPAQMRDYLTLVGDTSDNVKGAKGIGPVKAADVLAKFGTLDAAYVALDAALGRPVGLPTAVEMSLREFRTNGLEIARSLITLRADVAIPFEEISAERVAKDAPPAFDGEAMETTETIETTELPQPTAERAGPGEADRVETAKGGATGPNGSVGGNGSASVQNSIAVRPAELLAPVAPEWERQLEPRSIGEAFRLAQHMYASKLFSAYGTADGVLATILAGREIGLQSMASLRAFDIIDGKPTYKADLIRALVVRSGQAKYFRCSARTATAATFVTQRGDDPPMELTYTIDEAKQAWSKTEDAWLKSGYGKNPADMLVARAGAKLARLVYPEVVHGMYSGDEID